MCKPSTLYFMYLLRKYLGEHTHTEIARIVSGQHTCGLHMVRLLSSLPISSSGVAPARSMSVSRPLDRNSWRASAA